jgi:DNA-binding response OmpR family regulator
MSMADHAPAKTHPSRLNILVVDDDPDALRLLEHQVRAAGHDCRAAGTGREALALLLDVPADVVILDLGLPDLPGLEVLRRIHNFFGCQVMVLTGEPSVQTAISALRGGAVDYITKPLNLRILMAKMAAWRELMGGHAG